MCADSGDAVRPRRGGRAHFQPGLPHASHWSLEWMSPVSYPDAK